MMEYIKWVMWEMKEKAPTLIFLKFLILTLDILDIQFN